MSGWRTRSITTAAAVGIIAVGIDERDVTIVVGTGARVGTCAGATIIRDENLSRRSQDDWILPGERPVEKARVVNDTRVVVGLC